jgi:hypothetical protein
MIGYFFFLKKRSLILTPNKWARIIRALDLLGQKQWHVLERRIHNGVVSTKLFSKTERLVPDIWTSASAVCLYAAWISQKRLVGLEFDHVITGRSENKACKLLRALSLLQHLPACCCCHACRPGPAYYCACTWGHRARFASRARGDRCARGDHLRCAHFPHLLISSNTCNIKHLLEHKSEIDETFTIYSCNICVWSLQHMQHPDKTLAIYVWKNCNIWNI